MLVIVAVYDAPRCSHWRNPPAARVTIGSELGHHSKCELSYVKETRRIPILVRKDSSDWYLCTCVWNLFRISPRGFFLFFFLFFFRATQGSACLPTYSCLLLTTNTAAQLVAANVDGSLV